MKMTTIRMPMMHTVIAVMRKSETEESSVTKGVVLWESMVTQKT